MKRIKDGWLVEPLPVFFDSEDAAWNFADVFGGVPVRAKRQTEPVEKGAPAWCSVDDDGRLYRAEHQARQARPLGGMTDEDYAD